MGTDTATVTKEISTPTTAARHDAMSSLGQASLAEVQAVSAALKGKVPGLDGFHLDITHPVENIHFDKTTAKPAADFPVLNFVNDNDPTKTVAMLDNGSAFLNDANSTKVRSADVTPGASPPAADTPQAPPAVDEAPPPAPPPPDTPSTPLANVRDGSLNPVLIDPWGDKNNPANKAYNPLAPLGLADGPPGANVTQTTAGVENRAVTSSRPNTDEINGKIDGTWNWDHWYNTDFKTDDTFKDGKLDSRTTTYDTDLVKMKFQTDDPTKPVEINGVKTVVSHFDPTIRGYATVVTDSQRKTYKFRMDPSGTRVWDYTHS